MVNIPGLSHLQFAVLSVLKEGPCSGQALRGQLGKMGFRRTLAAFYQLMARLEESGLVDGWYEQQEVGGQYLRQRHYRNTAQGDKAWEATAEFYEESISAVRNRGGLAHV